jgi:hypothetical protein
MIKILALTLVVTLSLFGRLNPFEADENYKPDVQTNETIITEKITPIPVTEPLKTVDDGKRTVKVEGTETKKVLLKTVNKTKVVVKEKIVKVKPTKAEIEALCKVEPKTIVKKEIKKEVINPIYIKEQTKVIKHHSMKNDEFVPTTYKILPFITIDTDFNNLKITSRPKYTIVTYHVLKEKNKIAFDFLGDVWFYTRYKKLDAPHFDAYTLGNHKKQKFFRVSITLKEDISKYKVMVDNNVATITYKK